VLPRVLGGTSELLSVVACEKLPELLGNYVLQGRGKSVVREVQQGSVDCVSVLFMVSDSDRAERVGAVCCST
jgi:hypothetical protein